MKRTLAAVAALAALIGLAVSVGPGSADTRRSATPGIYGKFSLIMMVHTTSSSFGNLPGVNPWDGLKRPNVRYTYRSIPCTGPAPVNNIASDLPTYNNRVRGSRAPASMRAHPFTFRLVKVDGKWQMRGTITFTVCKLTGGPTPANDPVPDANKPQITVRFRAAFRRMNAETLRWHGKAKLRGGRGRYDDLTGDAQIAGYLFCFAPEGCARKGGKFLDGQFVLHGDYRDPTPDLTGG